MKKQYILLIFIALFLANKNNSYAQLVGGNVFMQGQWLEIGEINNGSFGTSSTPAGYHPHGFSGIGEVYDYGHDGWGVGAPTSMGDYTLPGSPFEGWEIQVNGARGQAFCCAGYSGLIAGGITTYSNSGGMAIGNWAGTAGGLTITQQTRVDTEASWVVVTTTIKNPTLAAVPAVYYLRSCDPDNDESWPGGSFFTHNIVDYQNDVDHRVLVEATGQTGVYTRWGLGTKDCRAVAFVYNSWPLSSGVDLATVWNKTYSPADYTVGVDDPGDIGIGLVYNIGTLNAAGTPGDSAIVSYAYVFGTNTRTTLIDSAFPDPVLTVNNTPITVYPDTFDACSFPTLDSVPLSIIFGSDKDWSWSTWTWSPGTGLSATTGVNIYADLTAIPGAVTYTVTGVDSAANMYSCNDRTFIFTIKSCHAAINNSPCYGTRLYLGMTGDSLGATYKWNGPGGFVSTLHDPTIFPATFSDSGWYHVIKTIGGINDTDSTYVIIHPLPTLIVSNNTPLCTGMADTLDLKVVPYTGGETFAWSGPNSFTSSLQFPTVPGFVAIDTGFYEVVATTSYGCIDSGQTKATMIPPPLPPVISDSVRFCQGVTFIPFTIKSGSGLPGGTFLWYPSATGGIGSPTAPTVNTSIVGTTTVWASEISGSCEGPRSSFSVRIYTTPAPPVVTGPMAYCQFIGPYDTLNAKTTTTGTPLWYTVATGGTSVPQPVVNINVAGVTNIWVSQTDSGCESARTAVAVTVHPKPAPPVITPQHYCQYVAAVPIIATASGTGDLLNYFGLGMPVTGSSSVPTPPTVVPAVDTYYVNETTSFGCVSDKAIDLVPVNPKPSTPITRDTTYCQGTMAPPLTADSSIGSRLNWYILGTKLPSAPIPSNNTPGDSTWYVSQTINQCEGDSASITVTTIYKPLFSITASSPWVCQFDSLSFAYNGSTLVDPAYTWSIPSGAYYGHLPDMGQSLATDSMIEVSFDSVVANNYIELRVSDDHGFCYSDTSIRITIVPKPVASAYSNADVCLGDTVNLALGSKSPGASDFVWLVDNEPIGESSELNIIASSSNSGGPFSISWNDSGRHVIQLNTSTEQGCHSLPSYDTVDVHTLPDASFRVTLPPGILCVQDSALFSANDSGYNNRFVWMPVSDFNNINKATVWGMLNDAKTVVTLTVTDPFGCASSQNQEIDPGTCCSVVFPNAFTPNGDGRDDYFRPLFNGYHNFHIFRIANRWGQTIFESTNSAMQWDGNFNGVPQDMGVYYYYIKYDCGGNTMEQTGDVTLVR